MTFLTASLRLAALALALAASAAFGAQPVVGRDYRPINPPQPTESKKAVEVIEFFYYGCPHCDNLQAPLRAWLKQKPADVEFKRVPAVLADSWIPLTRAYYALETVGLLDKLHYELFSAIHAQNLKQLQRDPKAMFDWVAKQGGDRQKFAEAYASFGVQSKGQRAMELTRNYNIEGTPALTVDGKYLTAPSMTLKPDRTIDYERFFKVLDQLIAVARKERAGK